MNVNSLLREHSPNIVAISLPNIKDFFSKNTKYGILTFETFLHHPGPVAQLEAKLTCLKRFLVLKTQGNGYHRAPQSRGLQRSPPGPLKAAWSGVLFQQQLICTVRVRQRVLGLAQLRSKDSEQATGKERFSLLTELTRERQSWKQLSLRLTYRSSVVLLRARMGNLGVSAASVPSRLELRGPRALCGEQCGRPTQCSRNAFANVLGCKNVSSTLVLLLVVPRESSQ